MYRISIIIPVFNGENTLEDTLGSVIAQPIFDQCEVIIVNDGSTDHTENLCADFCGRYNNIRTYTQENMGVSAARNRGILLAQSQYIMFLDADDFYVDNSLNTGLLSALDHQYEMILFSGYRSNVERNRYDIYMKCRNSELKGGRVFPMPELFAAIIYRRELLTENDISFLENVRMNEDQVFVVESLYAADSIKTYDSFLYIYNKNVRSVSTTSSGGKYYDEVLAWKAAKKWFECHANENKHQMLQYVQWKINSRTLLYAKHFAQGWHWTKGLRQELENKNALELLLSLETNQVMPYQIKDLQTFQSSMNSFVIRAKLEGMKIFLGRLALKIPIIRRWRDRKVYPYTFAGINGPDTHCPL